jgi:hypothetical protein
MGLGLKEAGAAVGNNPPIPGVSMQVGSETPQETEEEVASYLFDMLIGARRLAVARRHKFLAYLIGMAAEEARLLTQGRSASRG